MDQRVKKLVENGTWNKKSIVFMFLEIGNIFFEL